MEPKQKFYNCDWFMWVMLIFFSPVGIYLMWKRNKFSKVPRIALSVFFALFFIISIVIGNTPSEPTTKVDTNTKQEQKLEASNNDKTAETTGNNSSDSKTTTEQLTGELKVHYIDVGQADAILIQQGKSSMLIDGGNNADGNLVKNYISSQGISNLDYIVGTHAHEDHIGGLDYVVNAFKIGKVYFPKQIATSETFKDFVNAAKSKVGGATAPKVGESFKLGDATCTILAPNASSYEDANDYSIVVKVSYGNTSFLFTGDAEAPSESQMISNGLDLSSTVLKIGHHGSKSSTTDAFLGKVNPKYAVVSVGKDNSYGHPVQSTLDRLKNKEVTLYRTDESGTVIATSDGKEVKFSTQPGSYNGITSSSSGSSSTKPSTGGSSGGSTSTPKPKPSTGSKVVYWTPGGKSYHYNKGCSTLSRSKVIEEGPLSNCPKSDPCDKCVR